MCLAVPGEVLSIEPGDSLGRKARIQYGSIVKEASLALVPEAKEGDYVLVHAGVAITVVSPEEAERTFAYLDEIGAIEEELGEEGVGS